jgi:2-polyprenyl-3-methyl-5-hydroxy-6-metoxy-1,4-benzoquinol methylase
VTTASPQAYEPGSWEDVPCPYCGSRERRLYERFGWKLRFTYVTCTGCGLVYQSPRPRYEGDLVKTYDDYYSISEFAGASDEQRQAWVTALEPIVAEILKFDRQRTALLDVGSNTGSFLRAAKPHFREVAGVEISAKMRELVQGDLGVKVYADYETLAGERRFSCIHMSHVIEHVPNPSAWLKKTRELLVEDGVLVIAVPNILSLDRRLKLLAKRVGLRRGEWSDPTRTPDHLFEPTIAATLRFLDDHGFEVESHYTYSRSDETSTRPFNRLYRRTLLLGSNTRFYARLRRAAR